MEHRLPVLLALILNCMGIHIFTKPKYLDCLPYVSYVIFLTSLYFLIRKVHLTPCSYRKLFPSVECIIEFTISMFLMETIAVHFWYPLEIKFTQFVPKVPDYVAKMLYSFGLKCSGPCELIYILKTPEAIAHSSYVLSFFFLLCSLHSTGVLHFNLLMKLSIPLFAYLFYK